ncbi:MAG TPA: hypothetical protein PK281_05555 [Flavobacteriales bacterium]|nr:hypothetical protein [Flavobacteriales bacterium]
METTARAGMLVKHPIYGKGTIVKVDTTFYTIHFPNRGNMDISKRTEDLELFEPVVETHSEEEEFSMSQMERTLRRLLNEYSDIQHTAPLADKWQGGTLIFQPADTNLKPKEVPIETFFHKIVMVRDRLRVMGQQINANSKLSDADKVDLQQYITRIYGSMTTFNVLFKDSNHYFVGEKKNNE